MPRTVNFEGRAYTFPDDATDQEIADALSSVQSRQQQQAPAEPQRARPSTAEDVTRSFVSAVPRGVAALAALPRDINDLSANWAEQNNVFGNSQVGVGVRRFLFGTPSTPETPSIPWPSSQELEDRVLTPTIGAPYESQTTAGEFAGTIGEFAAAGAMPWARGARIARTVVPAVGSEAAGQAFEDTPYEDAARFVGGLGGDVAVERAIARGGARGSALRGIEAELRDAGVQPPATREIVRRLGEGERANDVLPLIAGEIGDDIPLNNMPQFSRQLGYSPETEARRLEQRFGDMTSAERSGNSSQRLAQTDMERSTGRPRRTMDNFNNRRAPQIARRARDIATRGLDPASIEGGGASAAANNLRGVWSEMRRLRSDLYAAADAAADAAGPINHNAVGLELMDRTADMVGRLRLARDPSHERWVREFQALQDDITNNRATWRDVHVVRTQLNEAWAAANPADRRVIDAFKRELDNFRQRHAPGEYTQAIQNADRYSSGMSSMFGRRARVELGPEGEFVGNNDIAGSRMDSIINSDLDERAIARMFVSESGLPSPAGLALARRLRQINDDLIRRPGRAADTLPDNQQTRVPYSIRDGQRQTVGSRGMEADRTTPGRFGVEQPTPELQSVREMVLDELVLSRLASRTPGQPIPADVIASRLRNALSQRGGREMMSELFTEAEITELDDLLRYFDRLRTPTGAAVSGTEPARQREVLRFVQSVLGRIVAPIDRYATAGMAGRVADSWAQGIAESRAAQDALRLTARPGPLRLEPPRNLRGSNEGYNPAAPLIAPAWQAFADEPPRRLEENQ